MFYVNMNPIMSNKNLANGEYPNVGPFWFKLINMTTPTIPKN
jgi:hypothetical protein